MHEWALAEAVVESVKKEIAGRRIRSVDSVTLSFGTLQNVDESIFREGLIQFLPPEMPLGIDDFNFTVEEAEFLCKSCGAVWEHGNSEALGEGSLESIHFLPEASHSFLSCPRCGSPDFEITKGRGVTISSIEITEEEAE